MTITGVKTSYSSSMLTGSKPASGYAKGSSATNPVLLSNMCTQTVDNTSNKSSVGRKTMPKNPYSATNKSSSGSVVKNPYTTPKVSGRPSSGAPPSTVTSGSGTVTTPTRQVIDLTDDEVVHVATRYVTPPVVLSGGEFAKKKQKILAANAARKVSAVHLPRSVGGPPRGDMLPVSIKRLGITGPRQTNLMQLEFVVGKEKRKSVGAGSVDYDGATVDCEGGDDDTLFSFDTRDNYKTPEKNIVSSGGYDKFKTPEEDKFPELKKVVTEEEVQDEHDVRTIIKCSKRENAKSTARKSTSTHTGVQTVLAGVNPTPLSLLRMTEEQEASYVKALAEGDVEDEARRQTETYPVWDPRGWHDDDPNEMPPSFCTFCRCPPNKCHNQLFGQFCQLQVVHALYNCNHDYDLLTLDKAEDIFKDRYNEVLQFTIHQENGTLDVKAGGYELPFCIRDTSLAQSLDYVRFYVYHFSMHRSIVVGRAQPQNGMNHIFESV
jgi:hypothetical protein